ncbi:segregation and condensation protein A, partial [bacterium]
MVYHVTLENFEGPMDLLLYLIRKNDLDIHDVYISAITNEYLEYIKLMQMLNIEVAGDFMVMASTLMHIKSKKLLPQHEYDEDKVEDLEEDLKQKLIQYKKFKEAAKLLKQKEEQYLGYHYREISSFKRDNVDCDIEATIFDLVHAFKKAYNKIEKKDDSEDIIGEQVTIEQKMDEILKKLLYVEFLNVSEVFNQSTKIELIVTFLAVLELIRMH